MGVIEYVILAAVLVCVTGLATFVMGKLAPDHPKYIDQGLWVLVVVVLVVVLLLAIVGHGTVRDIQIPHF